MEVRKLNKEVKERIQGMNGNVVPQGYIRTNLMIKPLEWKQKALKEVVISSDYGTSKTTNDSKGYPVLRMGNMKNGKLDIDDLVYLEMDKDEFNKFRLNKGDILFNRTNSADLVGKVSLFDLQGDYVCASYIVRFVINKDVVDSRYINYYMNTEEVQKYIKTLSTKGVQQVNVNPTILCKYLVISFPEDKEEQKKIIQILSTWDKAIELKEKIVLEKKKQQKAIINKFMVKNPQGADFHRVNLGRLIEELDEKSIENNQYDILSVAKEGIFLQSEYFNRQIASENNIGYKVVRRNNLVFSTMNLWMGSIDVVDKYEVGIVSPACKVFKINENFVDIRYMKYFMRSKYMMRIYKLNSEQGASVVRRNLDIKGLLSYKVNIAEIASQRKIAAILDTLTKEVELLQQEIELLKEQKKGLMQLLLTGIVRVKVD